MAKRKPGEGTIRLRKDGRWEGRVVIGYNVQGMPQTKNVLAKTKTACAKKLEELNAVYGNITGRASANMSFGAWVDFWYQAYKKNVIRPTTQVFYEDIIQKHIIPYFGETPLKEVTQSDLQVFYSALKANGRLVRREVYGPGLSDRTVRAVHAVCHAALGKARREALIPFDPSVGCLLPPKKSREMQVLTPDEMQRFLIQAREDDFFEITLLEFATGMRLGEVSGLKWDDLDFVTGALHIKRQAKYTQGKMVISEPKTKSSIRTVFLPASVVAILRKRKEDRHSVWMFPSYTNPEEPIRPASVAAKFRKLLKRAQCKKIRFHDLRHTFATNALAHGMDIKTLSTVLGHTSSATTIDVYSHVTEDMERTAAGKIEHGFGRGESYQDTETKPGSKTKPNHAEAFLPYKSKFRKSGTGGIYKINDHLYEGRYTPTNAQGKREVHTVYGKSQEEVEPLLRRMIEEVKTQIRAEQEQLKAAAK